MFRLLYISRATSGTTHEQIQDIQRAALQHNPAAGITGVLVHGGGLFMQVLEGPEQTVLRLYVKILDDRRHTDVRLIHISPAEEQVFKNCSMAVLNGDPLDHQRIGELRARRLESVQSQEFTQLMREFVRRVSGGT